MKENLIVLFGGVSVEHDISIISALQAINNIDKNFYNVIPVYLAKNYKWYISKNNELNNLQFFIEPNFNRLKEVCLISGSNYLHIKQGNKFKPKIKIDFALPVLHGVNGEDGKIVGLLSLSKIPYGVSGLTSSAVAIDKSVFKTYLKGLSVKSVLGETVFDYEFNLNPDFAIKRIEKLGFPLIVKPSTLGSSIGVKVCNNLTELNNALVLGFELSNSVLVENFLTDITEINVAVLFDNGKLIVSELEKPSKNGSILSFENKYINETKSMESVAREIPAVIDDEIKNEIVNIAKFVYSNLNFRGVVRFDFILCNNEIYLNEVNSIPGSLAFYLFKPKGITYEKLLNIIIKNGYENFKNENEKTYTFNSSVLNKGGAGVKK